MEVKNCNGDEEVLGILIKDESGFWLADFKDE